MMVRSRIAAGGRDRIRAGRKGEGGRDGEREGLSISRNLRRFAMKIRIFKSEFPREPKRPSRASGR